MTTLPDKNPLLRKICPKSGEKCDCPKGICNRVITDLKLFHEISHEHDAEQLKFYQQAADQLPEFKDEVFQQRVKAALFECSACKSKGFEPSKLPNRCTFCDGTFSGNPPTEEEIEDALEYASMKAYSDEVAAEQLMNENEAAQADSLEAHSLKYQACAQIMQLSSGRFALFGAYRAGGGSGIELLAIGEWAELEHHVCEYKVLAAAAATRRQERTLPAKIAADYDSLFGPEEG